LTAAWRIGLLPRSLDHVDSEGWPDPPSRAEGFASRAPIEAIEQIRCLLEDIRDSGRVKREDS
jgi:hypothetical protein